MNRRFFALMLAGLLLMMAGCSQQTPTDSAESEAAVEPIAPAEPGTTAAAEPEGFAPEAKALYDFGTVQIALPAADMDKLIVSTGDGSEDGVTVDRPLYPRSLLAVYEKASVEAAKVDLGEDVTGIGFLWGFMELDQASFERLLKADGSGISVFAKSDDLYYAFTYPTDVQFYREGGVMDSLPEEWAEWERLNALGDQVREDFIACNALTPYSAQEILSRPFLYESSHVFIKYYHYYDFDGSKSQFQTLVLSQPARQGEGGLWCVERLYDEFGNSYLQFPDSPLPAVEAYAVLQAECDAGQHPELLTPMGAAKDFMQNGGWHGDNACLEDEAYLLCDTLDNEYFAVNNAMFRTVLRVMSQPASVTDEELLDCVGSFRPDTWGVMGRHLYGSDWWPPLQMALEAAAVGNDQADRNQNMMAFWLTSYGRYAEFIGTLLQTQQMADAEAFQAALAAFSPEEQTLLLAAVE